MVYEIRHGSVLYAKQVVEHKTNQISITLIEKEVSGVRRGVYKNNRRQSQFFDAIVAHYTEVSHLLIDGKRPKICSEHFEYNCLSVRVKKGACATIFESESTSRTPNEPVALLSSDHCYTANSNVDHLEKKASNYCRKSEKLTEKIEIANQRKRRAEAKATSLSKIIGKLQGVP